MDSIRKLPVIKRLYPSVMKRWAAATWRGGFAVKRYNGLLWLLNWENFVDRQVGVLGGFEREQVDFILAAMRGRCDAFLDVGANFGLYSLQVKHSGLAAEIHAFEPDPRNLAQLAANLYLNRMIGGIHVHPVAVSERSGRIAFDLHPDSSTGTTRAAAPGKGNAMLDATTLDTEFDWCGRTVFLKIDIEGHEAAALRGAERLLKKNRCWIQVEIFPENLESVSALLNGFGYSRIKRIGDDHYFIAAGSSG